MSMTAGSVDVILAPSNWFQQGELHLKCAAASPLAEDIGLLVHWLETYL